MSSIKSNFYERLGTVTPIDSGKAVKKIAKKTIPCDTCGEPYRIIGTGKRHKWCSDLKRQNQVNAYNQKMKVESKT